MGGEVPHGRGGLAPGVDHVIPFFPFPPQIRRGIYTTNAIESINSKLHKIVKSRGHFPSDEAASKLIGLALGNITADWGRAAKEWKEAINQFAIFTKTAAAGRAPGGTRSCLAVRTADEQCPDAARENGPCEPVPSDLRQTQVRTQFVPALGKQLARLLVVDAGRDDHLVARLPVRRRGHPILVS